MSRGFRSRYWSGSKHADWVRRVFANVVKPKALPLGEWKQWDDALKQSNPFVFWYTEEMLDWIQKFINTPTDVLSNIRYWGYNRFVSQPHLLNTKLKPGAYHEVDTRILHGVFETLVNYIEIEKAWMLVVWNDEMWDKYHVPWYKRLPYFLRWTPWRCPEAGLEYLKWEMSLVHDYEYLPEHERESQPQYGVPTPQAVSANEQYKLYDWWKNVRPNRPDPMDAGGWSEYCRQADVKRGGDDLMSWLDERDEGDAAASKIALDNTHEIEEAYRREDDEMLIRLVRIRHGLWT